MLVLKRKTGEWVRLVTPDGHVLRVGISDADDGWARLAFDCPRTTNILREELIGTQAEADYKARKDGDHE